MRLIGNVDSEKQAFIFYSFLLHEGIHSTYEKTFDQELKRNVVAIWIYEEDEVDKATQYLSEFKANPHEERFGKVQFPSTPPAPPDWIAEKKEPENKKQISLKIKRKQSYPFMYGIIFLCVFLYLWNTMQQITMIRQKGALSLQIGWTPLQQRLMFDYPKANQEIDELLKEHSLKGYKDFNSVPADELALFKKAQEIPTWQGILAQVLPQTSKYTKVRKWPLFEKIREGEVWRLITPCFLHGSFLHILFNMAWAWLLLRQVEERLSILKLFLFIGIVGIVSNIFQYLVSGPYFLGFSGIVVGLVGFIWARQKIAPWEGYPLNKTTFIFIFIFILSMFILEIVSLVTAMIAAKKISANIANTAHIVGGICGYLLGRTSFFSRELK